MSVELSPGEAAEVANSAYALRLSADMLDAATAAPRARGAFDLLGGARLTGVTGLGAAALQQRTGFGYVAFGKGVRQGECLVSVRGTFKTSACDWITNARMAGVRGPSGFPVHAGFWAAAQSLLPQVRRELRSRRDVSIIHVVGHSLGGAIATLMADSLGDTGCGLKLYTFGAPRSGAELHAEYLTDKLGAGNIHRAWHDTDPVPMVPIFPYSHVPCRSPGHAMKGPGQRVNVDAHLMPEYMRSVGESTWASLPVLQPKLGSLESAEAWLAQAADSGGASILLSATALRLVLSALDWILKQLGNAAGLTLFGGATIIDSLARLLYSGALQSIRLAGMIRNLMLAAMRFMGRVASASVSITVDFVQYVLGLLFRFISTVALRAVEAFTG
ncbi:MAG: lipase family protein [Rhodanobacter sp.]